MSEHRPSAKTKRRQNPSEEPALPSGHAWLPINEWRLSQLEQFAHRPTQRIQVHVYPLNTGSRLTDTHYPEGTFGDPLAQPTARLAEFKRLRKTKNETLINTGNPNDPSPQQQRAMLARLEDMLERFQLIYLGLPSGAQILLRDRLEEAKLALWQFSEERQTQRADTRKEIEKTDLEDQLATRLEQLQHRLTQLTNTKAAREALDLGDDDSLWDEDCLTLGAMIESILLTLTASRISNNKDLTINQSAAPLSAPPGAVKLRQKSLGYEAIAEEKKRRKQREGEKLARQAQQTQARVSQGAQPTEHKEDALFESDYSLESSHSSTPEEALQNDDEQPQARQSKRKQKPKHKRIEK